MNRQGKGGRGNKASLGGEREYGGGLEGLTSLPQAFVVTAKER